ncbi:MAG: type II toxin-antitoxin system VapC family toxin [Rubrivivax sp.]
MIVLDTNVLSEPLKPAPAQAVLDWLDAQAPQTLYLSTIGLAELLAGVQALPAGKRRSALRQAVAEQVLPLFAGRVLPFDERAAEAFADVHASAKKAGNPISFADCAIAAIAAANACMVATRNGSDFKGTGVTVIDPWTQAA